MTIYSRIIGVVSKAINKMYNTCALCIQNVKYGDGIHINGRIKVVNNGKIRIGKNFRVNSGKNYNIIGGDTRMNIIVQKSGELDIKNNVGISNSTLVCSTTVRIEDDVRIGGGCKIYDTDFHSIKYEERMTSVDPGIQKKGIVIGRGAFIGAHSIILKGVQIGEYSIVGAGSVVTKEIPKNEIWAGNPAKFIRKVDTTQG